MATKKMKSFKGRRVRLTRLDRCGNVVFGACSSVVTSGFIKVDVGEEVEAGEEISQKNAWGEFCIDEIDDDITKWATVSVQFCEVDPDIMDIIGGATPVIVGGDTIGWTRGPNAPVGAFALEIWTGQAGLDACSGDDPEWGYFVVPFIKNGKLDGAITIEKGPLNITLTGKGFGAPASWGEGPYGDNPFLDPAGFPVGEFYGGVVTTVQPPDPTTGCAALFDKATVNAGDVFPADPGVTAQDAPNAAALIGLGYIVDPADAGAWSTGEFFTIGTFKFNWTGAAWAAGIHA